MEKIENLKLYNHNYWHILLHYKKKGKGYQSIFHGDDFFLAEDGASNPKAELEADLREFLNGKNIDKFPARYKWLKSQLETENEKYSSIAEQLKKEIEASNCKACFFQAEEYYFEPLQDKINVLKAAEAEKAAAEAAAAAKAAKLAKKKAMMAKKKK